MSSKDQQKQSEKRAGRIFIAKYNEESETDFKLDELYKDDFPDLRFYSKSNQKDEFKAEVVRIVKSEYEKEKESMLPASEISKVKNKLEESGYAGVRITIMFSSPPPYRFAFLLTEYLKEKIDDLKQKKFSFDRVEDNQSFWEIADSKTIKSISIRLLRSKGVEFNLGYDDESPQIYPVRYIFNALNKKIRKKKYSRETTKEIILILDCDFLLIDEADMGCFKEILEKILQNEKTKKRLNLKFKQIWWVNDVQPGPKVGRII